MPKRRRVIPRLPRIVLFVMALAVMAFSCPHEGDDDGGTDPSPPPVEDQNNNDQGFDNPDTGTEPPVVTDEPLALEGPPPPANWPPNQPYVVGNKPNPDGDGYIPQYAITPPSHTGENLDWAPGIEPEEVPTTAIINGHLHYLHPFDSDGDGLYDTMSHYQRPPDLGSPNINPGGNIPPVGFPPGTTYTPPVSTTYVPRPPPSTPTLSKPDWTTFTCFSFDGQTRLFTKWMNVSNAEWYEIEGNFIRKGSSDRVGWNWLGYTPHTTMVFPGEIDSVGGKVRAAASGGRLSAWSDDLWLSSCRVLTPPVIATFQCAGNAGFPQSLVSRWTGDQGQNPNVPIKWRIDGPDGTREGSEAAGGMNILQVDVGIAPNGYWRDYTLSVQFVVNGAAVLTPATAQTRCEGTEPPLPSSVSVTCVTPLNSNNPLVSVSWDAPTGITVSSYEVEGDLTYTGTSASFSRTGEFLTEYQVRVRAYDSASSEWTGWTGFASGTCPIAEPTGLAAECVQGEFVATWTDPANNPTTEFLITGTITEPSSSAVTISETVTTTEFRRVGGWADGTTIELQVQASNGGTLSSQVAAPTTTCASFPTGLSVDCADNAGVLEVTLTWDAVTGMTSYEIGGDLTYTGPDNTFTASGVYGQSYTVQVRATDGTTTTGWSPNETGECPPSTPVITGIGTLTQCDTGDLVVEWRASLLVDTYEIELDDGTNVNNFSGLASPVYQQSGVDPRTVLNIRVKAVNASGDSPWSPTVTIECEPVELTAGTATLTADTTPAYSRDSSGTLTRIGSTNATFDFDTSWTRPDDTYGCSVNGYVVRVYLVSTTTGTPDSLEQSRFVNGAGNLTLRVVNITDEGNYYAEVAPNIVGGHTDCGGDAASSSDHTDPVPYACAGFGKWRIGQWRQITGNRLCKNTSKIVGFGTDDGSTPTSDMACTVENALTGFGWLDFNGTLSEPCGLHGLTPFGMSEATTADALTYKVTDGDGDTAENTIDVEIEEPAGGGA